MDAEYIRLRLDAIDRAVDDIRPFLDFINSKTQEIRDELNVVDPDPGDPDPGDPDPGDPDPGDPDPVGGYVRGLIPSDGYLASGAESYVLRPNVIPGKRLSGVVTISATGSPAGPTWRLLVDGVAQPSATIDTTQFENGTHVISTQVLDQASFNVRSGSVVVVINNTTEPLVSKTAQAIIYQAYNQAPFASLAWGRVDVKDPVSQPLDPQLSQHPSATDDEDRQRLMTEKVWWVEGLTHQPTWLWQSAPILVKNAEGDYFIQQWNPQGGGAGVDPISAEPFVRAAPVYDGPRGVGLISPYCTMSPDRHHILGDGNTGWIGVDKAGRIFQASITGEVLTLLGPRSVDGVVQTDPNLTSFTLEQRINAGEKEYVGTYEWQGSGVPLRLPHDIWVCDSFPFEGVIADRLNNQIREFHFPDADHPHAYLMRSWHIQDVTSVWGSYQLQQEDHIAWVAVNNQGLWKQQVLADENLMALRDANGDKILGPDGKALAHLPPELIAEIPNAFWVRVLGKKAYVITTAREIFEYNFNTSLLTQIRGPDIYQDQPYHAKFVFAAVDEFGSIGPASRIYIGSTNHKTSIMWFDVETRQEGIFGSGQIINRQVFGSWTAGVDPLGHYMWMFCPHDSLPKVVSGGITTTSPKLWTGCLGAVPVVDPAISADGIIPYRNGKFDAWQQPAAVYGYAGHGMIGYSCDEFSHFTTWAEARDTILEKLEPFFDENVDAATKEAVGQQLFMQRTRKHFQ